MVGEEKIAEKPGRELGGCLAILLRFSLKTEFTEPTQNRDQSRPKIGRSDRLY